jgi:hypothetical protein
MTGRVDPKRKLFIVIGGGTSGAAGMHVFRHRTRLELRAAELDVSSDGM